MEKLTVVGGPSTQASGCGSSDAALDDFYKTCLTQKVVTDGGLEYARSMLEKAYGMKPLQTSCCQKTNYKRSFEFIRKTVSRI